MIAGGGGDAEQAAPDAEAGQRIVDLGLRQQPLRFGDLVDVPESRLIAGGRLLRSRRARRTPGPACWPRHSCAPLKRRDRAIPLGPQIGRDLLGARRLARGWSRIAPASLRANRRQVEDRKGHA